MAVSEERLIEILKEHTKEIVTSFTNQINTLKTELKETQYALNITQQLATVNETEIKILKR